MQKANKKEFVYFFFNAYEKKFGELNIELKFSYKKNTTCSYHPRVETKDILVENSTYKDTTKLKKRLFKEGLKECKCEKCGWGEMNKFTGTIPLEVHHIDGDSSNNKEENLKVLCPNCHAMTENFMALNKGNSGRKKRYKKGE